MKTKEKRNQPTYVCHIREPLRKVRWYDWIIKIFWWGEY